MKSKFSQFTGESCRVRVSKLLCHMVGQDRHRKPVRADLQDFYEKRWLPHFGKPQKTKVGPEGS
eukprot:4968839-Pyramimonas_sp.AAC.1